MKKIILIFIFIIAVLILSACSQEKRVIRATKDIPEEENKTEEFTIVEPEVIEVEYEKEDITDAQGYTEYERRRKYGTLIDFTTLDPNACEDLLEDFQAKRKKLRRDLDEEEEDLTEQTQNLKEAEEKLKALLANSSSDPEEIEGLEDNIDEDRDDILDKEDEIEDMEREFKEVDKTVDELDAECKRIKIRTR